VAVNLESRQPKTRKDILRNGHCWEWVWLLENHSDVAAHLSQGHCSAVDVVTVELDLASKACSWNEFVHAIQCAKER
jgi:hypothetical protein